MGAASRPRLAFKDGAPTKAGSLPPFAPAVWIFVEIHGQTCTHRVLQAVPNRGIHGLLRSQCPVMVSGLPESSAATKFPIDPLPAATLETMHQPVERNMPQCADEVHVIGHCHGREQFHPLIAVKPMQRLQNDFRSPGIGKKRGTAIAARRQQVASARLATTPDAQSMRMRLVVHARQCAGHGGSGRSGGTGGLARVNPKPIAAGGRSHKSRA